MEVFVLTEIDLQNVGFNPKNVYVFSEEVEATKKMTRLYNAALQEYGMSPQDEDCQIASDYAYVKNFYYLDLHRRTVDEEEIMDETNGHHPDLVRKINDAWRERSERFRPILVALYDRDFREIINDECFADLPGDEDAAFASLQTEWDFHASNYLQHVADDGDLETILNFLR